jgi:hypothetical protein
MESEEDPSDPPAERKERLRFELWIKRVNGDARLKSAHPALPSWLVLHGRQRTPGSPFSFAAKTLLAPSTQHATAAPRACHLACIEVPSLLRSGRPFPKLNLDSHFATIDWSSRTLRVVLISYSVSILICERAERATARASHDLAVTTAQCFQHCPFLNASDTVRCRRRLTT